jgi:hypothetical protein
MDKFENLEKVNQLEQEAFRLDKEGWFNNELFTWEWWILVVLFILPWILWYKFKDRNKFFESLLFGTLIIIPTTMLDAIGMQFDFWRYPTQLIPMLPRALPFDMSMVPVAYMFLYQYFKNWRSFIIALTAMSILYAFVGEPFAVWAELVLYIKWHYINSFFYYMLIGLTVRWIIIKLTRNVK